MGLCRIAGASLCPKPRFRYFEPNIRVSENRGHGNAATPWVNRSSVYSIFDGALKSKYRNPGLGYSENTGGPARTHLSFCFSLCLRASVVQRSCLLFFCRGAFYVTLPMPHFAACPCARPVSDSHHDRHHQFCFSRVSRRKVF